MLLNTNKLLRSGISLMLVGFGFLFFYLSVNTRAHWFEQQPVFFTGNLFLSRFIHYPGGISEYISLFVFQFFYSKLYGAISIAALLLITVCSSNIYLKLLGLKSKLGILSIVPALIVSYLLMNYEASLQAIISFILFQFFSILYLSISKFENLAFKFPLIVFVLFLTLFLSGISAVICMVFLIIFHELISNKKNYIFTILFSVFAAPALVLGYTYFSPYVSADYVFANIFRINGQAGNNFSALILFFTIPALSLFMPLIKKASLFVLNFKITRWLVFPIAFLMIYITSLGFDENKRDLIIIDVYAYNQNYKKVLELGPGLPQNIRKVSFHINRALYHEGILLDKAFSFKQYYGADGLILTKYYNSRVLLQCSELFHYMNYNKGSLHWAYEAQTKYSYSPLVLKRIIVENIALGEYKTADKFISILEKSIVHRKWAKNHRQYLYNDNAVENNPLLSRLRKNSPKEYFYSSIDKPDIDLRFIFNENPNNKMAFEYLMLYSLLQHDLATVIQYLPYLEKLEYESIPVHIGEAIEFFKVMNPDYKIDTGNLKPSEEIQKRFYDYTIMLMKHRRQKSVSKYEIERKYGNTYWYYLHFDSPITNKRITTDEN
jgi:hypothetical protein